MAESVNDFKMQEVAPREQEHSKASTRSVPLGQPIPREMASIHYAELGNLQKQLELLQSNKDLSDDLDIPLERGGARRKLEQLAGRLFPDKALEFIVQMALQGSVKKAREEIKRLDELDEKVARQNKAEQDLQRQNKEKRYRETLAMFTEENLLHLVQGAGLALPHVMTMYNLEAEVRGLDQINPKDVMITFVFVEPVLDANVKRMSKEYDSYLKPLSGDTVITIQTNQKQRYTFLATSRKPDLDLLHKAKLKHTIGLGDFDTVENKRAGGMTFYMSSDDDKRVKPDVRPCMDSIIPLLPDKPSTIVDIYFPNSMFLLQANKTPGLTTLVLMRESRDADSSFKITY